MVAVSRTLKQSLPAADRSVPRARQAVGAYARAMAGLTGPRLDAVRLAVSEAVTNAVVHAYRDDDGQVHISAGVMPGELWIHVADDGVGHLAPSRSPGLGLGLALMADAADEFVVGERASGGTEVRMRFFVRAGSGV